MSIINENTKFSKIFLLWLIFLFSGIFIYWTLFYTIPSDNPIIKGEKVEDFCSVENVVQALIAPFLETFLLFYLPFRFFKIVGIKIGCSIWVLGHLANGIVFLPYITLMGFFYYQLAKHKKWVEVILFHYLVNFVSVLPCL